MTKQIDALIKDAENKIENKLFTNKDLKDLINEVYNFDEVLLKTDFELEKTIERLEANQVIRAEFDEKVVDDENVRQLRIFFEIPFLDKSYPVETGLIMNENKNDISIKSSNRWLSFEETLDLMKSPEKLDIEDLESKIDSLIDVMDSNHKMYDCGMSGWHHSDVLEFSGMDDSVQHKILARSVVKKLQDLELKHGADDAINIMYCSLSELIIPDTAKGYEIFMDSINETEKEFIAKKVIEEKNTKKIKSLKM
ncbi:hypothetical protein [Pseudomonas lactis]|uniref:hypothetical protein n=1 Tax=Pseudomonas lactis TaxID=1615674 RepID=UPI003F7E2617